MKTNFLRSPVSTILTAGLIAGTIDILSAIFILAKGNAAGVLRYVAKGALGPAAVDGGIGIQLLGLLFHYTIAFSFTIGYFFAARYIPLLRRYPVICGLLYGIFVWSFMQFVVLPLTYNVPGPVDLSKAWKGIVILMYAIGLPIAVIVSKHMNMRDPHSS